MTGQDIVIKDADRGKLDNIIYVCSSKKLDDPLHRQGIALKKTWLDEMINQYGSVAKLAYYQGKPVAQITFLPEEADPTKPNSRENVVDIKCIYNSVQQARNLGIGAKLLDSLIRDSKEGRVCNLRAPCRFLVTEPFNTGEGLSLSEFFARNGFKEALGDPREMFLPVTSSYEPPCPLRSRPPLSKDRGKAIVFYNPTCEFSFPFANSTTRKILEIAPSLSAELINEWEYPEESTRRNHAKVIVNSRTIKSFFTDSEKFREEVEAALTAA